MFQLGIYYNASVIECTLLPYPCGSKYFHLSTPVLYAATHLPKSFVIIQFDGIRKMFSTIIMSLFSTWVYIAFQGLEFLI